MKKLNQQRCEAGNIVFRYNYCDGGKCADYIGFRGICSPENIAWHVKENRDIWCNAKEGCKKRNQTSPCRNYHDTKRSDLYEQMKNDYVSGWQACRECGVLNDWAAGADRKIVSARIGKLCILTTLFPPKSPEIRTYEKDRVIFGLFLIDDIYKSNDPITCDGVISLQPIYRLHFTEQETRKMRFWNYYHCENTSNMVWGSSQFRFLLDEEAAQILKDAYAIKKGTPHEQTAWNLFQHFCQTAGLDPQKISLPAGALKTKNQ